MRTAPLAQVDRASSGLKVPLAWHLPPPVMSAVDSGLMGMTLDDIEGLLMRSRLYAHAAGDLASFTPYPGLMSSPLRRIGNKSVQELTGICAGSLQVWLKCDHETPIGNSIHARAVTHALLPKWPVSKIAVLGSPGLAACAARMGKSMGWSVEHHSARPLASDIRWGLAKAGVIQHVHHCTPGDVRIVMASQVSRDPATCWIDACESEDTALAYACAAIELKEQLHGAGVKVDSKNPLLVLVPNAEGVSAAALAMALKQIYGRAVRTVLVEEDANLSLLPSLMDWPRTSEHYRPHLPWVLARRAVAGVLTVEQAVLQEWVKLVSRRLGWTLSPMGVAALASLGMATAEYSGLPSAARSMWGDRVDAPCRNVVVWLTEAAGEGAVGQTPTAQTSGEDCESPVQDTD